MAVTKHEDRVFALVNRIAQRVGSRNAFDLLRDARLEAVREALIELGIKVERFEEIMEGALTKTTQNIESMPVPSPFQRVK